MVGVWSKEKVSRGGGEGAVEVEKKSGAKNSERGMVWTCIYRTRPRSAIAKCDWAAGTHLRTCIAQVGLKKKEERDVKLFLVAVEKKREKGCSKKSFISSQAEESSIRSTQQSERANNPADQHSLCAQKETQINCFTLFPPHFEVNCKYSGHSLPNDRTCTCTSRIYRCVRVYESTV